MPYKASRWQKTHLTLQLCCLGLQSCQITSRKAQLALAHQKDFPGTVKSNTGDSVNSKGAPQIRNPPFLVPQLLLVSQQRIRTQMFTTFLHWMPHPKSAPCLNHWNHTSHIVLLKEKKELEAEHQAPAGKKEKIKSLGHKTNFPCLILAY